MGDQIRVPKVTAHVYTLVQLFTYGPCYSNVLLYSCQSINVQVFLLKHQVSDYTAITISVFSGCMCTSLDQIKTIKKPHQHHYNLEAHLKPTVYDFQLVLVVSLYYRLLVFTLSIISKSSFSKSDLRFSSYRVICPLNLHFHHV